MAGSKGRGKAKPPTPGEGPPSKDAPFMKGKVGRKFTAFKTTVKATAHQVGAWVRGGVASCVPGGQEEAVIDWDGAKPTVLRGDTPPPQVAHQVPLPASPKENTAAPAPAGDLRAASEEHHIEGAADALGAPCPAGHLVVASPQPQALIHDDSYNSTCNVVVVTPPLARCRSTSDHAPTITAAANTRSSPHTATNSSAGEGPTTSSRCSKKTVLHGSQILVAGAVSHDFKAATPQLVRQVTPYRAHQQQALADAKATIHPLKGQLCRERCLSKRHLAAALEQADTAAAYLQQVSRLQLALVREGAERVLAEAEAARQCALVGSIEQEVADLTTQLAALQQQLQQQASSAGKALRQAGYEKDMAGLKVEQLAAKLQQQAASSEAALTQAQGERDAAQQQVQGLSTQLQQVQGQLAGCQQELVEARAALPTPEQVAAQQQQQEQLQQQLQQWYEGYQALHAAYAQQGTMLQQVVSERDSAVHQLQQVTVARDEQQQQLTETQQQLQQITGERDSLAQQLGAVVAVCDTKQQQLAAVTQECERLAHTLQGVEQELEVTSEHLEGECAKGNMLQAALNELLATAAPGKVVGVGLLGDTVGDGAQGEVQMVSLQVQLRDGVTPEQAAAAGLTPPAALGQPWVEGAVRKLGDADRAVQEVAITALATLKGAVTGTVLGPRLRHVELGPPGQKPSLFLEKWDGNLRELVTQRPLELVERLCLLEGMALGVHGNHTILGIAHLDIKLENFLVKQLFGMDWRVCPADFGFSCDRAGLAREQRAAGGPYIIISPGYASPTIGALSKAVRRLAAEQGQVTDLCEPLRYLLAAPRQPFSLEDGQRADIVSLCISMCDVLLVTPGDTRILGFRWDMFPLSPLDTEGMDMEEVKRRHGAAGRLLDVWAEQVSAAHLMEGVVEQMGAQAAAAEGVMEKAARLCELVIRGMQSLGEVDLQQVAAAARELREAL